MPDARIGEILQYDVPVRSLIRHNAGSLEQRRYLVAANHNVTSVDDVFGALKEHFVYDPYQPMNLSE